MGASVPKPVSILAERIIAAMHRIGIPLDPATTCLWQAPTGGGVVIEKYVVHGRRQAKIFLDASENPPKIILQTLTRREDKNHGVEEAAKWPLTYRLYACLLADLARDPEALGLIGPLEQLAAGAV